MRAAGSKLQVKLLVAAGTGHALDDVKYLLITPLGTVESQLQLLNNCRREHDDAILLLQCNRHSRLKAIVVDRRLDVVRLGIACPYFECLDFSRI